MSGEQPSVSGVEIVEFHSRYAHYFRDLNYEWLEEYFTVEPYDRIVLNNPQREIIEKGGYVYFAQMNDRIVGTCALLKHTEMKYELAKMGVTKEFRGRGIGRQLVHACIDKVRQSGADTLVLATSRLLPRANQLYQSLGFQEFSLSEIGPLPYKRETIVMALKL